MDRFHRTRCVLRPTTRQRLPDDALPVFSVDVSEVEKASVPNEHLQVAAHVIQTLATLIQALASLGRALVGENQYLLGGLSKI
jgi:hypothetical protein